MQRTHLVLAAIAVVCLGTVGPAVAHPNHVAVDAQASPDGVVVIESVFFVSEGFLVLHADDGGEPGEILGHATLEGGIHSGVEIAIDEAAWREWDGSRRIWATTHRDANDDGEFQPETDPIVQEASSFVGTAFGVRATDSGRSLVLTGSTNPEAIAEPVVEVDRVALETDGHVAIHADDDGRPGRVVGHASLDADDYRNVTVELDEEYFAEQDSTFRTYAALYGDDGDGEFEVDDDPRITVDDDPVMSRFDLRRTNETGGSDGGDGGVVVTASGTTTGTDDGNGGPLPTPGFGAIGGVLAVLAVVVVVYARRRDGS